MNSISSLVSGLYFDFSIQCSYKVSTVSDPSPHAPHSILKVVVDNFGFLPCRKQKEEQLISHWTSYTVLMIFLFMQNSHGSLAV